MIKFKINSYDEQFDTFAITLTDPELETVQESLIPASLLPYLAPQLCALTEDLPHGVVGSSVYLKLPESLHKA